MRSFLTISLFATAALCVAPKSVQAQLLTGFAPPAEAVQQERVVQDVSYQPRLTAPTTAQLSVAPVYTPPSAIPAVTQSSQADPDAAPVDLTADNLTHDDQKGLVVASGDVMLVQSDRILRADEIIYDLNTGEATARGMVVLNEPSGDIYLSDSVVLSNEMKNGLVSELEGLLSDGSHFWAERAERENASTTTLHKARYTACDVTCADGSQREPAWQIKAREVKHDKAEQEISYKDATFEAFGVPVGYLPYFSHPDGTIRSKSGFLSPSLGYDSDLGGFVENQYYWAIADDRDATVGLKVMTNENPLLTGEYRQQYDNAALAFNGSVTSSDRLVRVNGVNETVDGDVRGHLFGKALWDINNKWRAGFDLEYSSDDQFLRQYDISSKDVLESQVYAERFAGRNYAVGRLLKFQDVRIRANQEDQPAVLPEIIVDFVGEPDGVPLIGGNWRAQGSMLGLYRDGSDRDVARATAQLGWQRRLISDYGFVYDVNADVRGDVYDVRDRDPASNLSDGSETRGFGRANMQASYPLQKTYDTFQARIAPTASVTLASNVDNDDDIPNEDSQDVQIDASNLFNDDRFPGFDRIEDESRATYGLRTGIYGYDGSYLNVFAGQSRRFDNDGNPFPVGSGLDDTDSDYVGEISGQYKDNLSLNYRFQLDNETASPARQEVDFYGTNGRFSLGARYLYAKALAGTNINESREQLDVSSGYYMTPEWRVRAGGIYDFGNTDQGLREAFVGLDYFGQCLFMSLTGERELTDEATGDGGTEILFRIGLKNLGEFDNSTYNPALNTLDSKFKP